MINYKQIWAGLRLKAKSTLNSDTNGELETSSVTNKTYLNNGTSRSPLVTADHAETLTNKTIDADDNTISDLEVDNLKAGVLNTSTTLAAASDLQVPSALAVKTYVDNGLAAQNQASEISYDNTTSGLSATNVQTAIDEVDFDLDATQVILADHIADTTDAHDASAISVVPASGIVATNVQAALEELSLEIAASAGDVVGPASATDNAIARFDSTTGKLIQNSVVTVGDTGVIAGASIDADTNTITNIENADIKAGAAIDATKIADGSVSSTEFQYLDGVTSSIQTQINGKQSTLVNSAGLAAALSDETGTGLVVFNSAPTITGASIQTPSRLDMKQDTLANLFTYALTASDGQLVFATDTEDTYVVKNATLSAVGGGSSSLDNIFQLTASEQLTDWASGDNATFLGGGTLSGTFVKETSTPLHGAASYKYTQAAGSLNDYIACAAQPVDLRFRGQQAYLSFPYQYNGATSDIAIVVYDVTNAAIISASTDVVIGTNGATSTALVGVNIPLTCASVRVGFHVKVLNSGKILSFDDVQFGLSLSNFGTIDNANNTAWESFTATSPNSSVTFSSQSARMRRQDGDMLFRFYGVASSSTGSEARIAIPNSLTTPSSVATIELAGDAARSGSSSTYFRNVVLIEPSVGYITFGRQDSTTGAITKTTGSSAFGTDTISFTVRIPIAQWQDSGKAIAVPNQQISSDTMNFAFKSTAIASTDPIGTFNIYTYTASSNTPVISASAPTQTVASMNANGLLITGRPFTSTGTTSSVPRFDILIGPGLKATQVNSYFSTAKSIASSLDKFMVASTTETGTAVIYDEITGILTLDAGNCSQSSVSTRYATFDIKNNNAGAGYFVFNASKLPSITAIPNLAPRIATLTDVKSSGTNGGTSASAAYQTRTLNTIVDPTGVVTSLTSNQFVLAAGTYYIEASAPSYRSDHCKIKIRNITDSTNSIFGTNEFSASAGSYAQNRNVLAGELVITSSKTFELQQYTGTSKATDGLGLTDAAIGESTVFSVVKITRIK